MDQPKPPAGPTPSSVPPTAPVVPPAPVVPQAQPMGGFAPPEGSASGAPGGWSPPPADPNAWSPPPADPGAWSPPPVEPMGPATTKRKGGSASAGTIALVMAGMVAIGGLGFAVGRVSAPASATTGGRGTFGGFANGENPFANGRALPSGGFAGLGGGRNFGASIQGTVESVDGSSLTLKLASGQTLTIGLGSSTTYDQQTAGSASDVTTGSTVIVRVDRTAGGAEASPGASASPGTLGTASSVTVVK